MAKQTVETMIEGVTGQFFEEQTVESMEAGLTQLLINEKEYSPEAIAKHAEQYSEKAFEKAMKSVIDGAIMMPHNEAWAPKDIKMSFALYRKYRPQSFGDLQGQNTIRTTLIQALKQW